MKKLVLLLLMFANQDALAELKIKVNYSPISNFMYQLDCVSGNNVSCSKKNYTQIWEQNFIKSDTDKKLIKEYQTITKDYQNSYNFEEKDPSARRWDMFDKYRIAYLQSKHIDDYLERLHLLTAPQDSVKLAKIIKHFYPNFNKWWVQNAAASQKKFVEKMENTLKSKKIVEKLNAFSRFYDAKIDEDLPLTFNFIYHSNVAKGSSRGAQIENYSLTEFFEQESVESRIDVVLHELTHFMYQNTNQQKLREFSQHLQGKGMKGEPIFSLLNEALASALGNGVVGKMFHDPKKWTHFLNQPLSLYNDEGIDTSAKAILPLVEEFLQKKQNIFQENFADQYFHLVEKAMGAKILAPSSLLRQALVLVDEDTKSNVQNKFPELLNMSSMWSSVGAIDGAKVREYLDKKEHHTVILLAPQNIEKFFQLNIFPNPSEKDKINELYKSNQKVLYAFKLSATKMAYLMIASDDDGFNRLAELLSQQKSEVEGAIN